MAESIHSTPVAKPKTLTDQLSTLSLEACMLASLLEGLDVLNDASEVNYRSEDEQKRRAANAMRAMIEAAIKSAWELTRRIEILEDAERLASKPSQ